MKIRVRPCLGPPSRFLFKHRSKSLFAHHVCPSMMTPPSSLPQIPIATCGWPLHDQLIGFPLNIFKWRIKPAGVCYDKYPRGDDLLPAVGCSPRPAQRGRVKLWSRAGWQGASCHDRSTTRREEPSADDTQPSYFHMFLCHWHVWNGLGHIIQHVGMLPGVILTVIFIVLSSSDCLSQAKKTILGLCPSFLQMNVTWR